MSCNAGSRCNGHLHVKQNEIHAGWAVWSSATALCRWVSGSSGVATVQCLVLQHRCDTIQEALALLHVLSFGILGHRRPCRTRRACCMCMLCISEAMGGLQGEQQDAGCMNTGLLPCWPLLSRWGQNAEQAPDCLLPPATVQAGAAC